MLSCRWGSNQHPDCLAQLEGPYEYSRDQALCPGLISHSGLPTCTAPFCHTPPGLPGPGPRSPELEAQPCMPKLHHPRGLLKSAPWSPTWHLLGEKEAWLAPQESGFSQRSSAVAVESPRELLRAQHICCLQISPQVP